MKRGPRGVRLSERTYQALDRIMADLLAKEATESRDAPPTIFGFPVVFNSAMPEDEIRLVGPDDAVRITGIGRCDG